MAQVLSWRRYRAHQIVSSALTLMHMASVAVLAIMTCWTVWWVVQYIKFSNEVDRQYAQIEASWDQLDQAAQYGGPPPAALDLPPLPNVPALPLGISFGQFLAGIIGYALVFTTLVVASALLEPDKPQLDTMPG